MNKFSLQIACSTLALVCSSAAVPACAQSAPPEPAAEPQSVPAADKTANNNDIIVTGTNISGVKPVGNTATVLTRQDAVKAGYSTPAELLRTLPTARPSEYEFDGGASTNSLQNSGGNSTIDLRGLGGSGGRSSTLLLIDGRRTVQFGTNQSGTEANQVPLAAIERIEVVADGASAVYGADAVAGVVNYIIRKDYQGGELTLRGNNQLGGFEYGLDGTLGAKWNSGLGKGNVLISYSYTHRDPYIAGKNPFLRYDGRSVGGIDMRLNNDSATTGFVPNIIVNAGVGNAVIPAAGTYVYYGLPSGANVGLTAAQLRTNDPNLTDLSYFRDYVGKMDRHQVAFYANQELGDSVEVYLQANYLDRKTYTRTPQGLPNLQVTLSPFLYNGAGAVTATPNPYYISGIPGVAPGAPLTVQYATLKDQGPRVQFGSDRTYNVTAGVRAKLPGDWKAEAYYTYGRNKGCGYCVVDGYVNNLALQSQINQGSINPLSSLPLTAAQRDSFTGSQTQYGFNGLDDAVVKFNGPLFSLPGGLMRAAVGGERLKQYNYNENTSVAGASNAVMVITNRDNSYYHRTVWSAFGEVYVPLVGGDMNVPLIKSLIATAAVRYDDYSDVGKTTNPKFGLTWEVTSGLSLYGSWGTSYVAPSLTDRNPSAYVSGLPTTLLQPLGKNDPRFAGLCLPAAFFPPAGGCIIPNMGLLFGSNPNLQPQTAHQWTLGATLKPGAGFRVNVNYFNIDYRNKIVFPQTIAEFLKGTSAGGGTSIYRGFDSQIIPIHNPATCSNSNLATADPILQALLARPIYSAGSGVGSLGGFPNFCALQGIVDSRFTNLARTKTDGLDIDVSWSGSAGEVQLNASVSANVILHNTEVAAPSQPTVDRLAMLGDPPNPLKWRGRASLGASYRGFTGTLFGNYYGSFINDQNRAAPTNALTTPVSVSPYTTFDLNLGYYADMKGRSGPLKGLRASVTFLNVFDRDPQLIINKNGPILEGRGSPFGRTVSFQLTGSF